MIPIDLSDTQSNIPPETSIRLNEVIKYISKSKKMTVLTGAGISCNAGIPDFRSSDGLYNMVKSKYPKSLVRGQDLFDVSLFRDEVSLAIFCTFMESLYKSSLNARPTETHKFIKTLKEKNKLLRCYTQNIDCIEQHTNLNMGINLQEFDTRTRFREVWNNLDVIQLHGNLHKLSCTHCFSQFNWNEEFQTLLANGLNPECSNCMRKYEERLFQGKRLTGQTIGLLRPDIVLYGENHPQLEILTQGLNADLRLRPDCLIIMGTSLKVAGVKALVKNLSKIIHEKGGKVIYINKTKLSASSWKQYIDYEVLSDCDEFIRILKREIPDLFLTQEQLDSKKLKHVVGQTNIKQELILKEEPGLKQEYVLKEEPVLKMEPGLKTEPGLKIEPGLKTEPGLKKEPITKQSTRLKKEPSPKAQSTSKRQPKLKKEPTPKKESNAEKSKKQASPPSPPSTPDKETKRASLKRKSDSEINIEEVNCRLKRLRKTEGQLRSPACSFNASEEEEEIEEIENYPVRIVDGHEVIVIE